MAGEFRLQRGHGAGVTFGGDDDLGLGHGFLNLAASASAPRARMPTSAPTATNSAPHSSQWRASASLGVRMPGALPLLRMRRMASSMSGFTLAFAVSPAWPMEACKSAGPMNTPSTPSTAQIASML